MSVCKLLQRCRESLILRAGREKNCYMNAHVDQDAYSIYVTRYFLKTCASYSPVCLMHEQKWNLTSLLTVRLIIRSALWFVKYGISLNVKYYNLLPVLF